ncbi:hypothetical protein BKA62DRAFT_498852 [Auriculariales sp. MPI-PUGE-AT-0066]|nr:hypothetical protein BKA62DRAFT_498852 [Auriculariales sp. MPI-PUGE-AT-0066]
MIGIRDLQRSFTVEPDEKHIDDLRVVPLSESPWVPEAQLSAQDRQRLERIAPSDSTAADRTFYAADTASSDHKYSHSRSTSYSTPLYSSEPKFVQSPDPQSTAFGHINSPGLPSIQHAHYPHGHPPPIFPSPQYMDAVQVREARDEKAELDTSGPPSWLGIFFDLAWTMTFSNLSNSTALTSIGSLINYGIFFSLAWMSWTAQVLYDVKFYSNDWYHRGTLVIQLITFGALSAFTKDFDAFNEQIDPHAVLLEDFTEVNYSRKTNLGISGLFAGARLLLVISYVRVLWYLPKYPSARKMRKRLYIQIGGYIASVILFTLAFVAVKYNLSLSVRPIKLVLWLGAFIIEILVYLLVPDVDGRLLVNVDTMGERISGLTTVILGEGVNNLGQTLILTASTTGFDARLGGIILTLGLVIFFAFLLYFDGLRRHTPSTRRRSRFNVLMHFPVHFAIIVLLQSLNNNFIYISLRDQSLWFAAQLENVNGPNGPETFTKAFRNIGINVKATIEAGIARQQKANGGQPTTDEDLAEIVRMLTAQAILSVFQNFDQVSDDMATNFTDYIHSFNYTARAESGNSINPQLSALVDKQLEGLESSSLWIPLTAGAYLFFLALIAIINAWIPQHRYIWFAALSRAAMGILVAVVAVVRFHPNAWEYLHSNGLLAGIVAVTFITQFFIDQIVICVAARKHKVWKRLGWAQPVVYERL